MGITDRLLVYMGITDKLLLCIGSTDRLLCSVWGLGITMDKIY
jgi:hypothetical protein